MQIHSNPDLLTILASITEPLTDLDVAIVDMHIGDRKSTNAGLKIALDQSIERPVVLMGRLDDSHLADDMRWQAVKGTPRIKYLRLPVRAQTIIETCQKVANAAYGRVDTLARELIDLKAPEDNLATLQHDLKYAMADSRLMAGWLDKARKAGYFGQDEQIVDEVLRNGMPTSGFFEGQYFDGVFCDIEGTLIRNGEVNLELVGRLKSLSEEKWITIWTGGNVKKFSAILRQHGIYWKVTSKYLFRDANVEHVIDDLPAVEFDRIYSVSYDKYEKVDF